MPVTGNLRLRAGHDTACRSRGGSCVALRDKIYASGRLLYYAGKSGLHFSPRPRNVEVLDARHRAGTQFRGPITYCFRSPWPNLHAVSAVDFTNNNRALGTVYCDPERAELPPGFIDSNCAGARYFFFITKLMSSGLMRSGTVQPSRSYSAKHCSAKPLYLADWPMASATMRVSKRMLSWLPK